ncbi:hypothetical protein ACSSS7_006021 [Eimeria intestinalis]
MCNLCLGCCFTCLSLCPCLPLVLPLERISSCSTLLQQQQQEGLQLPNTHPPEAPLLAAPQDQWLNVQTLADVESADALRCVDLVPSNCSKSGSSSGCSRCCHCSSIGSSRSSRNESSSSNRDSRESSSSCGSHSRDKRAFAAALAPAAATALAAALAAAATAKVRVLLWLIPKGELTREQIYPQVLGVYRHLPHGLGRVGVNDRIWRQPPNKRHHLNQHQRAAAAAAAAAAEAAEAGAAAAATTSVGK